MQDLFLKTLRWYLVVSFTMAGIATLYYADSVDSIKPVLPAILCLGAAFVMGVAWKEIRRKILFATLVIIVGMAYVAQFTTQIIYILTGEAIFIQYFYAWFGLVFFIGFPAMMIVFAKVRDY